MITRGYLIGEIVDGLSTISQQVSTRCKLGLTDLNIYLEDLFKDYLNEAFSYSLDNINTEKLKSNEPGIDLKDECKSLGVQITSTKTSEKINNTLSAISERSVIYKRNIVLIIGSKQGTYTLNKSLCKKIKFSKSDIWDIDDLCRQTISLSLIKLQNIYDLLRRDLARVKIELEIPDEEGNYATSINSYIEKLPKPKLSNFNAYYEYQLGVISIYDQTSSDLSKHFEALANKLSQLPRITREFYAFLLERRELEDANVPYKYHSYNHFFFSYNRLIRICKFPDLDGEIMLLKEHGFVDIEPAEEKNGSTFIVINMPINVDGFISEFSSYVESKKIGYRKSIVTLDFSEF